jgi:CysZ protein
MTSLPRALALSVGQLGDPAILKVLGKSLAVTLAIFAALGWGASFAFEAALEWLGLEDGSGLGALLAVLTVLIAGWLLFRLVALAVLQFFAEDVVRAVEALHYPAAAAAPELSFVAALRGSLRSTGRALLVNLAVSPLALVLLFTGVGPALVFWLANAPLLGRELQDMVWLRHRGTAEEAAPIGGPTRFVLGGLVAALLAVPFVNFLAPVLGAASATHLVHRGRQDHA